LIGILPDGFKIKKGDLMSYVPYSMGRMTYLWGSDAKEFKHNLQDAKYVVSDDIGIVSDWHSS